MLVTLIHEFLKTKFFSLAVKLQLIGSMFIKETFCQSGPSAIVHRVVRGTDATPYA